MMFRIFMAITFIVMVFSLSGCGTTSAPTESTTNTTDKTSNSTMDATSSTSPGKAATEEQVEKFTENNFAQVKVDMARGGGEHLTALAALLNIPKEQENAFFALTQEKYISLYQTDETTVQQMLARLNIERAALKQSESL